MFKKLFLSVIIPLTLILSFATKSTSQICTVIPICTQNTNQYYAVISDGMIVWRDGRNGTWDIFGYDLSVDTDSDGVPNWLDPDRPTPDPAEFLICELPYASAWKTDISSNFIVFSYEHEGIIGIGGYDLNLDKKFIVTTSTAGRIAPAICNGFMAWQDYRKGNWGIWGCSLYHDSDEDGTPDIYDLDRPDPNKTGIQLSAIYYEPPSTFEVPDISDRVVVWEFRRVAMHQINICGYDLQVDSDDDGIPNWIDPDRPWNRARGYLADSLAMFNITLDRPSWRGGIATSGNFIVWEEGLDKDWDWSGAGMDSSDLHGYDLSVDSDDDGIPNYLDPDRPESDPAEFVISSAPGKQGGTATNLGPAISGNWVVWIDLRNGNADIYGYDLSMDSDKDGIPNYCDPDRPDPDPAEMPIITDPSNQWTVRGSAISGSVLTWIDDRNGNKDVYACILPQHPESSHGHNFFSSVNNNTNNSIRFVLYQNYPNPFNPTTKIKYNLPKSCEVVLKIFNLTGQELVTLVNGFQIAGEHQVIWSAEGLPSGVYFYNLQAGEFSETKKLILQK